MKVFWCTESYLSRDGKHITLKQTSEAKDQRFSSELCHLVSFTDQIIIYQFNSVRIDVLQGQWEVKVCFEYLEDETDKVSEKEGN